jgi:hypothetical protein
MSDPSNPQNISLEFLRKQAKALLKQCRAGDPSAIGRIRAQVPRMADPAELKLADVHHALARELGYANWAALKRYDDPVERFLVAVRGGSLREAQRELAEFPDMAEENIHAACAIGDPDAAARHLSLDAGLSTAEHNGWPPLFYACASPLNRANARRHSAGILECVKLLLDAGADPNTHVLTDPADPESKLTAAYRAVMSGNISVMALLKESAVVEWKERMAKFEREKPVAEAFRERLASPQTQQRMEQLKGELRAKPKGDIPNCRRRRLLIRCQPLRRSSGVPGIAGGRRSVAKNGVVGEWKFGVRRLIHPILNYKNWVN